MVHQMYFFFVGFRRPMFHPLVISPIKMERKYKAATTYLFELTRLEGVPLHGPKVGRSCSYYPPSPRSRAYVLGYVSVNSNVPVNFTVIRANN